MDLVELARKAAPLGAILSCIIYAAQAFGLISSALHSEYATKADVAILETKVSHILDILEKEHEHGPKQRR